jgi:hypothetical protein
LEKCRQTDRQTDGGQTEGPPFDISPRSWKPFESVLVHIREVRLLEFRVCADGVSGVRFRGKRALEEKTDKSIEVKKRRVRASGFSEHEVERRGEKRMGRIKLKYGW